MKNSSCKDQVQRKEKKKVCVSNVMTLVRIKVSNEIVRTDPGMSLCPIKFVANVT